MKRLVGLILVVFLFSNISAVCNETQIDINSAPIEELDKIVGIGPVYAQRIIEGRLFNSIDGLLNISGIGEKTLEKIKAEGLACVNEDTEQDNSELGTEEQNETKEEEMPEESENLIYENFSQSETIKEIELEPISLNSKDIKSEDNNGILKRNWALGGVITFCVIFGALFFIRKGRYKNEFN
ncbi:helix-hairpin-helix domain-containing protein [Candidatus Pacearchaeota archaeon]|nr:helix-hairpin-helix domain-containing protein [Candidatus Pacearchaeota archaeon]